VTIQFPDVSAYTPVSLAGAVVVIARASIGNAKDGHYDAFKADAAARGIPFTAYHFLNSPSLGVSAETQADFAFSVIGPSVPCMMDIESNRSASANVGDALRFLLRYRANGGICHLAYLPHWYWQSLGSPDLSPLRDAGVHLVSSSYTTYSDSGPGWTPYGGYTVVDQWQFADNHPFNGGSVDWNAYKAGGVADYIAMVTGGRATMEQNDAVQAWNGQARNVQVGWVLGDLENLRDWWTAKPGDVGFLTAKAGSRLDLLMQAVAAVPAIQAAVAALAAVVPPPAVPWTDQQVTNLVAALAPAVAAVVVANHDALSETDLARVQSSAEAGIRSVLGSLG